MIASAPTVCVVGAGRLGRVLAAALAENSQVRVLSRTSGLIPTSGGSSLEVGTDPSLVREAGVVLLAVPAHDLDPAIASIASHLSPGGLVVNLATDLDTDHAARLLPGVRVVACKIVGQSGEISRGNRAALIVSGADPDELRLLSRLLAPIGDVVEGTESTVLQINRLVATHMIDALRGLEHELSALGLPDQLRQAAVGNVAVGTLRALATGTAGPFLQRMLAEHPGDLG